jgi:valyl-tRNA synthetase
MPFITEALWRRIAPVAGSEGDTVMLQPWPEAANFPADAAAEAEMAWVQGFIVAVRQIRSDMNLAPGRPLPVLLQEASAQDLARVDDHRHLVRRLARLEEIRPLAGGAEPPPAALQLLGEMRILVPMAGHIDRDAETARLAKLIGRLESDLERAQKKLANPAFVDNAPEDIVLQERSRVSEVSGSLARLKEQLERVRTLA